ncbi:MAG TPA: bifunctional phosphoribosylaminoimidazolecarboxamide formyltransferase/inosine monophosphate cyclohydrolase [Synechococcales bacterium UBA12195]|jgi:phosphoribosylaminoimidazolecarboxamide formyltransferase/IMP cyclohydrolase|nr:bifunctional phosphoribosylaminoimidazolecarboxamide formyltransferase/IMP cyclohydrolase [Cyanobacteriota bacterium]MEC8607629.1 bifunctional phosphoribosylaminoimidazolecarboxamide formyltransferase/IMP cyclohydrolase [Cyanobacteriota bacterium]RCL64026.1 MAG: bifunctional phosphoribosylaminoimidazolecarboxamide formyltransferase/IMP cyclohydrolase PurH [Synechococcus sp. MED-G67]HCV56939.1 bifunctional phosphoribosylaminoimidazolecarboxamide formyltransferase/inosine monophosphate cyclohyd
MARLALLSVSNKEGIEPLARALVERHGFQLLSSGGTAKCLADAGLPVTKVAEHTGAPEILGGRVKTLHPRIHGGILGRPSDAADQADMEAQNIPAIELVVVNLYPFEATIAKADVSWDEAIEKIDIGGPAMVRAAAKNHAHVSVLTSPTQYERLLGALDAGPIPAELRRQLALEAFQHTAAYDSAISTWLGTQLEANAASPHTLAVTLPQRQTLRYGENPHQAAAWYSSSAGWGGAQQLQGKELSYNNLLDLDAAQATVERFPASEGAAAVVIKHTNPCGVATGRDASDALARAIAADPVSAFGGIVALNQPLDGAACASLQGLFLECIVAPEISAEAREILSSKSNLRLLELPAAASAAATRQQLRSVLGGVLLQERDQISDDDSAWQVVSQRQPDAEEMADLRFAWRVVRHVRSNAIVVAKAGQSLGVGAGQMNRVGSAGIALDAAGDQARGAVLASDGFFPFDDTVKLAAERGIRAVIQPGGSKRDSDSIAACDAAGLVMVTTGRRHFLH